MKAIDLKMMIMELQFHVLEKNTEERIRLQNEIFNEIGWLYESVDGLSRELEYTKDRLEDLNEVYGKGITEADRLDPADYADLPFPDVEDMAPAEEVEGR